MLQFLKPISKIVPALCCLGIAAPCLAQMPSYADRVEIGRMERTEDGRSIGPHTFAVVDLNGDGFEDIVLGQAADLREPGPKLPPLILLNDGKGSFFDATAQIIKEPIPTFFFLGGIIMEDFNGDNKPDLFLAANGLEYPPDDYTKWPCERNALLLSGPNGKLRDVSDTHLPDILDFTHGSSAADFDGDDDVDIWVNNIGCSEPTYSYLLENNGKGRFKIAADTSEWDGEGPKGPPYVGYGDILPETLLGSFISRFVDANADGDMDLFISDDYSKLLVNDGTGRFHFAPRSSLPEDSRDDPFIALARDFDLDGREDLILYQRYWLAAGVALQLLRNGPGNRFVDETRARLSQQLPKDHGGGIPFMFTGDLNGDGREDIMVKLDGDFSNDPNLTGDVAGFYLNEGCGTFKRLPASMFEDVKPRFVPVDANSDGFDDFITFERDKGQEVIYLIVAKPKGPAPDPVNCELASPGPLSPWVDNLLLSD